MYTLETVEQTYRERLAPYEALTPDQLIDLSVHLFHEIKLEGPLADDEPDSDMLLFEYGAYDFGQGKRFLFGIARQWCVPENDEPYQLHIELRYDPAAFKGCGAKTLWSDWDPALNAWRGEIRATKGYALAQKLGPQAFELWFEAC